MTGIEPLYFEIANNRQLGPERHSRGVAARRATDAAAAVHAAAAQEQSVHRRAVIRPAGHRAHEQRLVEDQLAMVQVALGESPLLLEVERRDRAHLADAGLEGRSVRGQRLDGAAL